LSGFRGYRALPDGVKKFMVGVYKMDGPILSILDVEAVSESMSGKKMEAVASKENG
jgi:hypothetical protein